MPSTSRSSTLGAVIYSIPSLALFLVLPAVLGVGVLSPAQRGRRPVPLHLALLTRTVADALISVQGETTQAAFAMGYRPLRQLLGVELPMALPVLFAGLRVATVANISLVSVGALVGVGGLGALFTSGFQLGFVEPIVIGIVLSVLLAGLCDIGLVLLQRRLTPWTRVGARCMSVAIPPSADAQLLRLPPRRRQLALDRRHLDPLAAAPAHRVHPGGAADQRR